MLRPSGRNGKDMEDDSPGLGISVPYEIALVRPLKFTTRAERRAALKAAHWNTELLPQELIYVDLCTDSGVSAGSTAQLSAQMGVGALEPSVGLADEASGAFSALARACRDVFGFEYIVPTTQGRAAERIWLKQYVKPNTVVPGNMLFPSTRTHIEMNGGKVIDVIGEAAHDLHSEAPFKGNVDAAKLEAAVREHGREKIACIYVELSVNACGGHPVSLQNLKEVRAIATAHGVPLFLDACRIFENSRMVQEREPAYAVRSIKEIACETCSLADGLTMSALKDLLVPSGGLICMRDGAAYQKAKMQCFLDGAQPTPAAMRAIAATLVELSADAQSASRVEQVYYLWRKLENNVPVVRPASGHAVFVDVKSFLPEMGAPDRPTEALAAFVYEISGVRLTKGPPPAASQAARGIELLRLAIPARKYVHGHLDDAARAVTYAYEHRREIKKLKREETSGRGKYDPAYYTVE